MIIVSYDFESDKRRAKFSKFLKKIGRRFQYSVYELKHSDRVLKNTLAEIEHVYLPYFTELDSIVIVNLCKSCESKVRRYGYAANEDAEVLFM
jgi:CRISPR-associated endonuclease Cas2